MAGNGRPPFKRQLIKRIPSNVPRDIKAMEHPVNYDPSGLYGGVGAPRSAIEGKPHQLSQIVFPPWIFPPLSFASYFYPVVDATLIAGPVTVELDAAAATLGDSVFTLPTSSVGVIRSFNLNVNNLLATSDIVFTLLINGAPLAGQQFRIFPRAAASVSEAFSPEETVIEVPEGARMSWRVAVGDAVAYQLGVSYRGWYYTKDLANKYHMV